MDDLLKQFLANAPWAALLAFMLNRVYTDWQAERIAQNAAFLLAINNLNLAVVQMNGQITRLIDRVDLEERKRSEDESSKSPVSQQ